MKRTAAVPRNVWRAGTERGERSAGLDEKRMGREEYCKVLRAHVCVQHLWAGARIQAWVEALGQGAGNGAWVGRLPGRTASCSLFIARWFRCWCCSSGFLDLRGGSGGRNSISCVAGTVSPLPCYQESQESGFLYVQVRTCSRAVDREGH